MYRAFMHGVLAVVALCAISCSVSFKMNGANINYQTTHSISVADFPNNAPMVNPTLPLVFKMKRAFEMMATLVAEERQKSA